MQSQCDVIVCGHLPLFVLAGSRHHSIEIPGNIMDYVISVIPYPMYNGRECFSQQDSSQYITLMVG